MGKHYLVQALRKNMMKDDYMAGYINSIIKSLIVSNGNDLDKYRLLIFGSCWGTSVTKCDELVEKTFFNVDTKIKNNIKICLFNHYKSNQQESTFTAFKNNGFPENNIYSFYDPKGFSSIFKDDHNGNINGKSRSDHAKMFLITYEDDVVFFMMGSSNFSYTTYVTPDNNTNQLDLAIIPVCKRNETFVNEIIDNTSENNNSEILKIWRRLIKLPNDNNNDDEDESLIKYWKDMSENILSFPFSGRNLIKENIQIDQDYINSILKKPKLMDKFE